nr:hypothetical protein SYMBAF_10235 [Serratia symbiotica]
MIKNIHYLSMIIILLLIYED